MEKQILLPRKQATQLISEFQTDKVTMYRALTFQRNSSKAKVLRAAALQKGGLLYTGYARIGFAPDCSTKFLHSEGRIIQGFGEGISVEIDVNKNQAMIITPSGNEVVIPNMTVAKWNRLLYCVQLVVNELGRM